MNAFLIVCVLLMDLKSTEGFRGCLAGSAIHSGPCINTGSSTDSRSSLLRQDMTPKVFLLRRSSTIASPSLRSDPIRLWFLSTSVKEYSYPSELGDFELIASQILLEGQSAAGKAT